ncbi:MAG: hypothetical protein HUU25_02545 [Candidatus Sumerlaeia bacterium]|nr:hypothetical protein [Candidatus Sumerlaeia bacterium]
MLTLQSAAESAVIGRLSPVDWVIVVGFIFLSIGIGVYLSKRGQGSSEQYFKGGGGMGWMLLGTSMVATTFAADTPLALTGWVVTSGVAQNWYWWSMVPITMLGVFFFARLWKRANPLTDMEFVYVRYSGNSAHWLRACKALWLAIPYGCIVMGWVNKAMGVIINYVVPDFPRIPFIDQAMLWLFLATPLSSNINPAMVEAIQGGVIDPIEVGYSHHILQKPILWTEYEAGAYSEYTAPDGVEYPDRHQEVLEALGITYDIELNRVGSIEGVPNGFLLSREVELDGETVLEPIEDTDSVEVIFELYKVCAGVNQYKILFFLFLIVCAYTAISGLWGVVVTDFIQFWIAMFGCIVLAVLAVRHVGGIDAMLNQMADIYGSAKARGMVNPLPTAEAGEFGLFTRFQFLLFMCVFWWSNGFTDGGSYFAQRMLSAKDERNAALGYMWYAIAHYALRMWPWLLVGFAAAVLYPRIPFANGVMPSGSVAEAGYVKIMLLVLPAGMLGLLVAALMAAYMSTISTQVNLGASYLMNDFYRPFIAPGRERRAARRRGNPDFKYDERHYVRWGIIMTVMMAFAGIIVSLFLNTIGEAWFLLAGFNGGIGVIYLLRWYWWRINAWTEIVCLLSLLILTLVLRLLCNGAFGWPAMLPADVLGHRVFADTFFEFKVQQMGTIPFSLLVTMPASVGLALLVTFLTAPTDLEKLKTFHRRVQAGGIGWRRIDRLVKAEDPSFQVNSPLTWENTRNWLLGSAMVYFWLVGVGKIIIGPALNRANDNLVVAGEDVFFLHLMTGLIVAGLVSKILPGRGKRRGLALAVVLAGYVAVAYSLFHPVGQPFATAPLGWLLGPRLIGILMLAAGVACGGVIARSFSTGRWSDLPAGREASPRPA